ncbi:hypothetical protein D1872_283420 [compost metagenome]
MILGGQFFRLPLRKAFSLRAHQDDPRRATRFLPRFPMSFQQILHRMKNGLRLKHHPPASAIGRIIHAAVLVSRIIAEIHRVQVDDAFFPGFP